MLDQLDHALRFFRSHPGHRLIEQQELRLGRQGQRHFQAALLAVRQLPAQAGGHAGQRHLRQQGLRFVDDRRIERKRFPEAEARAPVACPRLHRHGHVVQHRQTRKDIGDLVRARQSERHALVHRAFDQIGPVEYHLPTIERQGAGENVNQCGFARAVRADQCMHLTTGHRQAGVVERVDTPEVFAHCAHIEQQIEAFTHDCAPSQRARRCPAAPTGQPPATAYPARSASAG